MSPNHMYCSSPHPDHIRTVTQYEALPGTKVTAMPQGVLVPVQKHYAVISCTKVAGHEQRGDLTCSAFVRSIKTPDTWPFPAKPWPKALGMQELPKSVAS